MKPTRPVRASPARPLSRTELEASYVRLERSLFNVVYHWVWSRDDAIEIVQEAFLRVWHARERVWSDGLDAYVYRVALNLAASRRRRRKVLQFVRWPGIELADAASGGVDDGLIEQQQVGLLRQAIDGLPERLRRVLLLCDYAGMSYRDAAKVLGVAEGTVGSRRHEAMSRLQEQLAEHESGRARKGTIHGVVV